METAQLTRIEEILSAIMVTQEKQGDRLDTINRRIMAMEGALNLSRHKTDETQTYVKRIQPYIRDAISFRFLNHRCT